MGVGAGVLFFGGSLVEDFVVLCARVGRPVLLTFRCHLVLVHFVDR